MKDSDQYMDFVQKTIADKKQVLSDVQGLVLNNLNHLRAFYSTLLTIDVALIGAIFATFSSDTQRIIQIPILAWVGVAALFLDALYIVTAMSLVLLKENSDLVKRFKFMQRSFDEVIELAHKSFATSSSYDSFSNAFIEKGSQFVTDERNMISDSQQWASSLLHLYLISLIFILGLIAVLLSAMPATLYHGTF